MPPSNTLIISPLRDSADFFYDPQFQRMLEAYFRSQISSIQYWNFSPYFQTLNIVFDNEPDSVQIRELLNGHDITEHLEGIPPCYVVVSYGIGTHSDSQYLALPKLEKQFKLSPPPSPPAGYVQGIEDPPNKTVHAEDYEVHSQELHTALKRAMTLDDSPQETSEPSTPAKARGRSSSMAVVYHPEQYGSNPSLPSINVEDTDFEEPVLDTEAPILAHTARPPVELMHE